MRAEGDRLPLVLATRIPILVVSMGAGFLRFLGRRRRGVRAFRRALRASGMPRAHAAQLVERYEEMGSIRKIMADTGILGFR